MCIYLFLEWQVASLCTKRSHSSTFLKVSTSVVSFQIWRIIVIELHKQPAEEVRFPVTSRRFTLGNKESGKRDCDRSSVAYWNKSPTWMIYLFPPLWSIRNAVSPLPLFELRLVEYLGRAAPCKTVGCEALVPIFSLCMRQCIQKGKGVQRFWPEAILCRAPWAWTKCVRHFRNTDAFCYRRKE